jgi:predicted Fe-Mo cluster-binding NifX family protein
MAQWLRDQGVGAVIVGGIGAGAVAKLQAAQIRVLAAGGQAEPLQLVQACLQDSLRPAKASCSQHEHGEHHHHHHGAHEHGESCCKEK